MARIGTQVIGGRTVLRAQRTKFGGKTYILIGVYGTKRQAKNVAQKIRKQGMPIPGGRMKYHRTLARVSKGLGDADWAVYARGE